MKPLRLRAVVLRVARLVLAASVAGVAPARAAGPADDGQGQPLRALASLAREYDGRVFCAPRGTRQDELAQAVTVFTQAHPETGGELNDEQTLRGLAERFPCDPAGLSSRGPDARLRRAFEDLAAPVRTITPVFSQLVATAFPAGFAAAPAYEAAQDGKRYLRDYVLVGENLNEWTEMITLSGAQGMADQGKASLEQFLGAMVGGYRKACPDSFVGNTVDVDFVRGYQTATAIVSCGQSPLTQGRTSETAMIVAIKGSHDFYTLQWAERGQAWSTPLPIDQRRWLEKFARLAPIRLCPKVAGEAAPYPSCFGPEH